MKDQKIIVTISGADKIGIVAAMTAILAKYNVNIIDIKQTIMQNHFVMTLLGDISQSENSFSEIKQALSDEGAKFGMEVWIQRKDLFDKMHTI